MKNQGKIKTNEIKWQKKRITSGEHFEGDHISSKSVVECR